MSEPLSDREQEIIRSLDRSFVPALPPDEAREIIESWRQRLARREHEAEILQAIAQRRAPK